MEFVKSIDEMKINMQTLDGYLERRHDPEFSLALGIIKRGLCFIAAETKDGYHFYPSRFIGYSKNTMSKHQNNTTKDGRKTNPVISKILNGNPTNQVDLECAYIKYCERLGLVVSDKSTFGYSRKYWKIN